MHPFRNLFYSNALRQHFLVCLGNDVTCRLWRKSTELLPICSYDIRQSTRRHCTFVIDEIRVSLARRSYLYRKQLSQYYVPPLSRSMNHRRIFTVFLWHSHRVSIVNGSISILNNESSLKAIFKSFPRAFSPTEYFPTPSVFPLDKKKNKIKRIE